MLATWIWSEVQRRTGVSVITEYFTFERNIKWSGVLGLGVDEMQS